MSGYVVMEKEVGQRLNELVCIRSRVHLLRTTGGPDVETYCCLGRCTCEGAVISIRPIPLNEEVRRWVDKIDVPGEEIPRGDRISIVL